MLIRFALAASVLAVATPVLAQSDAPAPAPTPKAKADKKQCRSVGSATGSILARQHECHTKAEWAEIDSKRSDQNDRLRDDLSHQATPGQTDL